jgi:hypothetical protein
MDRNRRGWVAVAIGVGALVLVGMLARRGPPRGAAHDPHTVSRQAAPSSSAHGTGANTPASTEPAARATRATSHTDDAAARAEQGREVARATWGAGPDQLGHIRPQEANPEGPMSHALGPDGTLHVLDQTNGRIQRFSRDGRPLGATPVRLAAAQDIALSSDGSYVLMDRLVDRAVSVLGPDGRERARIGLAGDGIAHTGAVTGVFVDGADVLVEREHGPLVRVGDTRGGASEREEVPGRPTRDGTAWITAGITDAASGRVYVNAVARPSRAHRFTREVRVGAEARALVMLDSDRAGTVYLGVLAVSPLAAGDGDGGTGEHERVLLLCFDGQSGRPSGRATLPSNRSADETFREFAVRDEGGVVYAVRDEQGVSFRSYACEPY